MGIDVTVFVERLERDQWRPVQSTTGPSRFSPWDARSLYQLLIAGSPGKHGTTRRPLAGARGLPRDVSAQLKKAFQQQPAPEAATITWFTLEDLEAERQQKMDLAEYWRLYEVCDSVADALGDPASLRFIAVFL